MDKKMIMGVMMLLMIISLVFAIWGVQMHTKVVKEEAKFHVAQAEYFSLDKATRESAATGSELTQDLVEIVNYPSALMELKLLGVGKILTGIYVLLFGILIALVMMPVRLGNIIKKKK